MKPLISVIIPVYNVERYLSRCIESVLAQTYQNLEILLIDDGSSDSSGLICDEYKIRDSRINVLHKENGGVSSSRNLGLSKYKGEFLMFVDADDYMSEDAVELLYTRIIQDCSDMVVGRAMHVDENGERIRETYSRLNDSVISQAEALRRMGTDDDIPCYSWAKLYKRSVVENLQFPTLTCAEDVWFFLDVIINCKNISTVSQIFYYYVQRPSSAIHTMSDSKRMEYISTFLRTARFMLNKGIRYNASCYYTSAVFQAAELDDLKSARKLLSKSFTLRERIGLQKKDFHSLLRSAALYIPSVQQILRWRHNKKQ